IERRNIVISQDCENFAESSKLQVAPLMLAPNFLGKLDSLHSLRKFDNPKENFGFSLHKR
ncbi:MAG: hypothetical protein ABF652_11735, partial [Clostridium beijerinckii]